MTQSVRACVITRAQMPLIDMLTPNVTHVVTPMCWLDEEDQHVCVLLVRVKFSAEAGRETAARPRRFTARWTGECSRT